MAKQEVQPSDFYVYEIIVDGAVRYIGKGRGDRVNEHLRTAKRILRIRSLGQKFKTSRFYNRLAKAVAANSKIETKITASNLTEPDAYASEIAAIEQGSNGGLLWNVFSGGLGFSSDWIKSRWEDPEYREANSKRSKSQWADPGFRSNQISVRNSPEHKAHMSKVLKAALANPDVRKKMSDRKKEALKDQEYKKAFFDRMNAARATPEWSKRQSEIKKAQWADQEFREAQIRKYKSAWDDRRRAENAAKVREYQQRPESRRRAAEIMKKLWQDPKYRENQMKKRVRARVD